MVLVLGLWFEEEEVEACEAQDLSSTVDAAFRP